MVVTAGRVAGIAITLLGVTVIAGWFAGLTILTSLSSRLPSMKFDTACGLVLVGLSIIALGYGHRPKVVQIGLWAAVGYGLLGLAVLVEDVTDHSFGFDNPFAFAHVGPAHGRMAATAAVCFVALSLSVLAAGRRQYRLGQFVGMFVVALGSVAVVGYAFGVPSLYKVGAYSQMALHTAVAFLFAGFAVLFARCDEGYVALLTENSTGGLTVRRMLVPVVAGPAVVGGLLDWAAKSNALTTEFRLALFTVSMILLSTTLVWIIGSSFRHVDLRRAGAEGALNQVNEALAKRNRAVEMLNDAVAELRSSEDRFRASVEHLHEALSVFTAIRDDRQVIVDFRWEFANTAASEVTGYSSDDLVGQTLLTVLPHHGPSGMLATYCAVVDTGIAYVEPSLWYEDVWGDGRRRRRAFDVRATRFGDGFVVVTREVTEERAQEEELARQRHELERSNREVKLLNALGGMLQSCVSADEAYELVAQSCAKLFSGFSGSISVMHPSRDILEIEGSWGDGSCGADSFVPADCWALRRGRPHVSGQIGPRCAHLLGLAGRRCLCVPMIGQSDTLGMVHVVSPLNDIGAREDFETGLTRQLAITVAGQIAMAFANLRLPRLFARDGNPRPAHGSFQPPVHGRNPRPRAQPGSTRHHSSGNSHGRRRSLQSGQRHLRARGRRRGVGSHRRDPHPLLPHVRRRLPHGWGGVCPDPARLLSR